MVMIGVVGRCEGHDCRCRSVWFRTNNVTLCLLSACTMWNGLICITPEFHW